MFIAEAQPSQPGGGIASAAIHLFELEKRKLDKFLDGVAAFEVSANGEKILFRQGQSWFIAATGQPVKPGEGKLKTDELEVHVDPRAEWSQMYRETWRIERDFSYDPHYHGLDLKATAGQYEPCLKGLAHRTPSSGDMPGLFYSRNITPAFTTFSAISLRQRTSAFSTGILSNRRRSRSPTCFGKITSILF